MNSPLEQETLDADRLVSECLREFLAPPTVQSLERELQATRAERDALRRLLRAELRPAIRCGRTMRPHQK